MSEPFFGKHSWREFLFQLLTITAGVLIALSIEALLEWNNHRALVREAKATLAREITDNKTALDRHIAAAPGMMKNRDTSLQMADELLTRKKSDIREFSLGVSLPSLSSAAWQSAERVGALTYMDYGDVQAYAKLYGLQDLYVAQQRRLMEQTVATLSAIGRGGNPHEAPPADLERFRSDLLTLGGLLLMDAQLGEQLSELYAETLQRR
jgi:hypothetical protein